MRRFSGLLSPRIAAAVMTIMLLVAAFSGLIPYAAALGLALVASAVLYQAHRLRQASAALQASEYRTRHLASHDWLTGLANRAGLEARLDEILSNVRPREAEAAVLLLDIDRFKDVNDTLGHMEGDEVLREVAERLEAIVCPPDIVARLGSDEFAIVKVSDNASRAARTVSEQVLAAFASPFHLDEDVAHIGVSIGIAVTSHTGTRREEILRRADIALHDAKKRGAGRYRFFAPALDDMVKQRRQVEIGLRRALATGTELYLAYQPLYSAKGEITGAEALLRWNHPVYGSVSPMCLIAVAEESGFVAQIGDWVLEEACRMAKRVPIAWVAVNVSPVQLCDHGFTRRCLDIIHRHGIAPHRIQIEVTEAAAVEKPELAGAMLHALKKSGVRVALDDFGTGYSSMSYLHTYPIDRLKIDRSFVNRLSQGNAGEAIISAMIEMGRALRLDVVAEGVETPEQRDLLIRLGCQEMQGYLFSRPISGETLAAKFNSMRNPRPFAS